MSNIEEDLTTAYLKGYADAEEKYRKRIKELEKENEELLEVKISCSSVNIIENLQRENKSKQKAYDDCYCEYKKYKQFDSIPKQKVKDKIEEIKEDKESKYFDKFLMTRDIDYAIEILEELLEDK